MVVLKKKISFSLQTWRIVIPNYDQRNIETVSSVVSGIPTVTGTPEIKQEEAENLKANKKERKKKNCFHHILCHVLHLS